MLDGQVVPVLQQGKDVDAWDRALHTHKDECNVVFHIQGDKGFSRVVTVDPYIRALLRRKYYRARRLVRPYGSLCM
jgi:Mlc titration factor MtfA (ptsG expression regulator)